MLVKAMFRGKLRGGLEKTLQVLCAYARIYMYKWI